MKDRDLKASSIPLRGGTPVRDSRGRWVRQSVSDNSAQTQEFVFDDRIFEGEPPPLGTESHPPPPEDAANPSESLFSDLAAEEPTGTTAHAEIADPIDEFKPARPWASLVQRGNFLRRPFLLFCGAVLLGAMLLFFRSGNFGAGSVEPIAPPPPPPEIVAPVVVPGVPKPTKQHPSTRVVARPPAAARPTPKPVVNKHATPNPAIPKPAAPSRTAVVPARSQPDASLALEGEPAPVAAASSPARQDEEGWFNLAEEYQQMGDEKRAETLYRRILSEGTQQGRAALLLGDLFAGKGDFDRAQEFYRTSKRLFQGREQQTSPP